MPSASTASGAARRKSAATNWKRRGNIAAIATARPMIEDQGSCFTKAGQTSLAFCIFRRGDLVHFHHGKRRSYRRARRSAGDGGTPAHAQPPQRGAPAHLLNPQYD